MTNCLVTGGAGFIGSHLTAALLAQGHRVWVVDDLSTGKLSNLPQNNTQLEFIETKVEAGSTLDNLFKTVKFDYILHESACASVAQSVETPYPTHQSNFDATLKLLELARQQNCVKRFLFASSAAVYGFEPESPKTELSMIKPVTPYGIDKYASERYVLSYHSLYSLPSAALRYFNVFGPRQNPSSPYSGVISIFMDSFINSDTPQIKIFGDGEQTRDFIYVNDVVQANLLALEKPAALGQVFNTACGQANSLLDLIKILEKINHKKAQINFLPARPGDIKKSVADITQLKTLSFLPQYNFEQGLTEYFQTLS